MPVRRRDNGSITGSKRYKEEKAANETANKTRLKQATETIKSTAQKVGEAAKTASDTVKTVTSTVEKVTDKIGLNSTSKGNSKRHEMQKHDAYGGVELPTFEPSELLAKDLYSVSSTAKRIKKSEVDEMVEAIEEQRQGMRVVNANLDLNYDIFKAGEKSEKMKQSGIQYGTYKVNTDTKFIQFQEALVNNEIAYTKLSQTEEKLIHEEINLGGLRNETDQRKRFWEAKHQLGESRIKDTQMAKLKLDAKIGAIDVEAINAD